MSNKNSQIILEDNRNDFSFKKKFLVRTKNYLNNQNSWRLIKLPW